MIAIYAVHPIMYQVPIFRSISEFAIADRVDVCVFFGSDISLRDIYFEETQTLFRPDTPSMLDGYKYIFPLNLGTRQPAGFFSRINLGFLINIFLRRYSAVLIHGYDNFTSFCALFLCLAVRLPVIWRGENTPTSFNGNFFLTKFLKKFIGLLIAGSTRVAYSCKGNYEFLREMGVPVEKLFFAPCSVDNDFFSHGKNNQFNNLHKERLMCIFSGRFTDRKRPFDLLNAVYKLNSQGYEIGIIFVGNGPLLKKMKLFSERYSLNVQFLGFLNQSEMATVYKNAHVGVVCSDHDPSPKVVNEMMASGLPVIASHLIGTAGDLVRDGVTGFVYPCGNVDFLAEILKKFSDNPSLLSHLRSGVLKTIPLWDAKITGAALYENLKSVADGRI